MYQNIKIFIVLRWVMVKYWFKLKCHIIPLQYLGISLINLI